MHQAHDRQSYSIFLRGRDAAGVLAHTLMGPMPERRG